MDSDEDLLAHGRRMYLPRGTPFLPLYQTSPRSAQRKLGERVIKENLLYDYDKEGLTPIELERDIIKAGDAIMLAEKMGRAQLPLLEKRSLKA